MKHVLMMLIALIFAAPVWAADTSTASTAATSSAQAEAPAAKAVAKAVKKTKKHKPAKKLEKAATLTCPSGCSAQSCGGVQICAKNKPAPICTKC